MKQHTQCLALAGRVEKMHNNRLQRESQHLAYLDTSRVSKRCTKNTYVLYTYRYVFTDLPNEHLHTKRFIIINVSSLLPCHTLMT